MSSIDDYRRSAEDCLRLADRASPETRAVLIIMAQAWLRLAEWRERAVEKSKSPISIGAPTPNPCNQHPRTNNIGS